jgi:predicted Abi (CAAX) family protease
MKESSKMNVYLFLWNPKKDTGSFRNYDKVQSNARAGKPYSAQWICPSTRPRPGDIAIVQRTGNRNNGMFAKGTVVSTPYHSEVTGEAWACGGCAATSP